MDVLTGILPGQLGLVYSVAGDSGIVLLVLVLSERLLEKVQRVKVVAFSVGLVRRLCVLVVVVVVAVAVVVAVVVVVVVDAV